MSPLKTRSFLVRRSAIRPGLILMSHAHRTSVPYRPTSSFFFVTVHHRAPRPEMKVGIFLVSMTHHREIVHDLVASLCLCEGLDPGYYRPALPSSCNCSFSHGQHWYCLYLLPSNQLPRSRIRTQSRNLCGRLRPRRCPENFP